MHVHLILNPWNEWMDGWLNEWMDVYESKCMNEWIIKKYTHTHTHIYAVMWIRIVLKECMCSGKTHEHIKIASTMQNA